MTAITAGSNHTCALLSTGSVRCWGRGDIGILGYGNTNHIGDNETPASAGDVNIGGTVTQINTGGAHTCVLLSTGSVRCWGFNFHGYLGYGNTNIIGDNELPFTAGNVQVINPAEIIPLTVTIGGQLATLVTYVNSTTITAVTSARTAGAVNVVITDGGNNTYILNNGFTYQACTSGASGTASNGTTAVTNILLCLNGGNLTLTSPSIANFTSVTAATTEQNTSASLNGVTVEDLRGSQAGWSLVCKSSNLTGILDNSWILPLYKDSASKLSLTPSGLQIVNGYGALSGLSDYTAAQSTTELSNQTSNGESNNFNLSSFATNHGVGKFEKNLNLDFTVPPYIRAQAYVGSLICSVS